MSPYAGMLTTIFVFALATCGMIAFTIVSNILHKSNNLGTKKGLTKTLDGGFVIYEKGITTNNGKPLTGIKNPVIIKNSYSGKNGSYIDNETFNTIDDDIDSADLSGIKWHK